MKRRRSRQGLPEEAAPGEHSGAETPELDELRALVEGLEEELAAEREAHGAARQRAEEAEALVAETRTQVEEWVEESRGFMDQRVAEARAEVESERSARAVAEERLQALLKMEADARSSREEQLHEFDAAHADLERTAAAAGDELDQLRTELARERELRLELEQRLDADEPERGEPERDQVPVPAPAPDPPVRPRQEPVAAPLASLSPGDGCLVCGRSDEGRGAEELVGHGWAVEDDARVCPRCGEAGWQLAPGVDTPFRRYSDRRPRGQSGPGDEPARTAASQTSDR